MIRIRQLVKNFSSAKALPEAFSNPQYYSENTENCMNKTGIEQFSFEFNQKKINIFGLPTELDSMNMQNQYMQDLSEIAVNADESQSVLIQLDPTFHIYEKRKVIGQIQQQVQYKGQKQEFNSYEQNPTIPANLNELKLEPYLLELSKADKSEIELLYDVIQTRDLEKAKAYKGYFSQYFDGKNPDALETEAGQNMYMDLCKQLQLQITNNPGSDQNDYITLLVLNILKGTQIYLGDIPSLYQRIMLGDKIELSYLRSIFKQILHFLKENDMQEVEGVYQMLMGQIFQQPVDFYLYYLMQQIAIHDESTSISCYVNNLHFEPLKLIAKNYGQEGFQHNQSFQEFMQLGDNKMQTLDEEKIEKHALLDIIFGTHIWEKEYVSNKFPYINEDYTQLSEADKMAVQKLFFSSSAKYKTLKDQILR